MGQPPSEPFLLQPASTWLVSVWFFHQSPHSMLEGRDVAGGLVYVAGAGPLQRDATTLVQGPEKSLSF